jgi:hypothetical protein
MHLDSPITNCHGHLHPRVRKTSEKIQLQQRTRLKAPDTLPNGSPINAVRVPFWSESDQAEHECPENPTKTAKHNPF